MISAAVDDLGNFSLIFKKFQSKTDVQFNNNSTSHQYPSMLMFLLFC